jgi:thioredoxin 1
MSTICVGGVCVPTTAVVPLFFICIRWVLQKAVELGLLPKSIQDKFSLAPTSSKYEPCCGNEQVTENSSGGTVIEIESEDQFRQVLKQKQVICKFTAEWCKPCKEVQPEYMALAGKYPSTTFCTVDVDELDDVASEYKVAMMPTFLVFKDGKLHDTKTGISLLEDFVQKSFS